jgi:non-ribosomal peptide synthase protein (TIGR01720 family)
VLDARATDALLHTVPKTMRMQAHELLLTALVQTMGAWTGSATLLVDLEGHGREEIFGDVDLSRTVGWFTTIYPLLLDLEGIDDPGVALRSVKERIRSVPGRGLGYGLLRYLAGDKELAAQMAQLPQAEISFNYLGQLDTVLSPSSPFAPAGEKCGPVHHPLGLRPYLLDISATVIGGQLQMTWTYSGALHSHLTIEKLAEAHLAAVEALVAYCQSPEAQGSTPSDFPLACLDQATLDWLVNGDGIGGNGIEDIYPLSPMQEGMFFYSHLAPNAGVYLSQIVCELGNLAVPVLEQAWRQIMDRHPILRTAFIYQNLKEPLQLVYRQVEMPLTFLDWRELPPDDQQQKLQHYLMEDRTRGFHPAQPPLMRLALIQTAADRYQLVWTNHHLLLDGWATSLLLQEFLDCYEACRQGAAWTPAPARPYRDYIGWLQSQDLGQAEAFWRRLLKGITTPTPLGIDRNLNGQHPKATKSDGLQQRALSVELTQALQSLSGQQGITINTMVQGAWALLLHTYSGERDVLFGATVAGRPAMLAGAESMIGLFINTLPVRVQIGSEQMLISWLQSIQEQQVEMRQYEHSPLVKVQSWSETPQHRALFESIVVFENYPTNAEATRGKSLQLFNVESVVRNNLPLTVRGVPGERLSLEILYDSSRFDSATITRILDDFTLLLQQFIVQPTVRLAELIKLISQADQARQHSKGKEFKASQSHKLKQIKHKRMLSQSSRHRS